MSFLITAEELNQYIVCKICKGYLREAYTIKDCLHTFCKSCLFDTFTKGQKVCPHCQSELAADPYKSALKDNTVQGIVDSIFPHFHRDDMREEAEFYRNRGISLKHGQGSHIGMSTNYDQIAVSSSSVSHSIYKNSNMMNCNNSSSNYNDNLANGFQNNNDEEGDNDLDQSNFDDNHDGDYGFADDDDQMEVKQPDDEEENEILKEKQTPTESKPPPQLAQISTSLPVSVALPATTSVVTEAPVPTQVSKQSDPKPESVTAAAAAVVVVKPKQKEEQQLKSRLKESLSQADHMVPRQEGYKPKPGRDKKNHQALIKIFARLDVPDAQILPILDKPTLRTNMGIKMNKVQKHIQRRLYSGGEPTDGSEVVPAADIVLSCRGVDIDPNVDLEDVLDKHWQAEIEDTHIVLNFHRDPDTVPKVPSPTLS